MGFKRQPDDQDQLRETISVVSQLIERLDKAMSVVQSEQMRSTVIDSVAQRERDIESRLVRLEQAVVNIQENQNRQAETVSEHFHNLKEMLAGICGNEGLLAKLTNTDTQIELRLRTLEKENAVCKDQLDALSEKHSELKTYVNDQLNAKSQSNDDWFKNIAATVVAGIIITFIVSGVGALIWQVARKPAPNPELPSQSLIYIKLNYA